MQTLRLEGVSKVWKLKGRDILAVDDVSFTIEAGALATLEGPSGAGKTTLLSLIGGLDYPTRGSIYYDDLDIASLSLEQLAEVRRRKVAFVFQDYVLFDELAVLDNVALALRIATGRRQEAEQQAREWIARVGLSHRLEHRPGELSGGEKQRVGVARALVKKPELLIVDEPTSNLDDENRRIILNTLLEYQAQSGAIVLVSTHDAAFFDHSRQRLRMEHGRLVQPLAASRQQL